MLTFAFGLLKNWKVLVAIGVALIAAYGAFAIYRFVDELHDKQTQLEQTIADRDREIDNLNVELVQERARLKTISTLLDQRDADLAESKRLQSLLDGMTKDANTRIDQLRKQLIQNRTEDRDRLYSADPAISQAEVDAINLGVNCKLAILAGETCD